MKIGTIPEQELDRVRAARLASGTEAELCVDANGSYCRKEALAFAEAFTQSGVTWFEEPVSSDDSGGLRLIRDRAFRPGAARWYGTRRRDARFRLLRDGRLVRVRGGPSRDLDQDWRAGAPSGRARRRGSIAARSGPSAPSVSMCAGTGRSRTKRSGSRDRVRRKHPFTRAVLGGARSVAAAPRARTRGPRHREASSAASTCALRYRRHNVVRLVAGGACARHQL